MLSALNRPLSSARTTQPLSAMMPPVENRMATSISPSSRAATVSGPPQSSGTKLADRSRPYTDCSPGMQNGFSGQSGGPPSVRSSVRSLTFANPSSSAFSAVTTNEFESMAGDGVSATRPFGSSWVCSRATVSVGIGGGLAGAAVQELQRRRRVLGGEVDVARLERGVHEVADHRRDPAARPDTRPPRAPGRRPG